VQTAPLVLNKGAECQPEGLALGAERHTLARHWLVLGAERHTSGQALGTEPKKLLYPRLKNVLKWLEMVENP